MRRCRASTPHWSTTVRPARAWRRSRRCAAGGKSRQRWRAATRRCSRRWQLREGGGAARCSATPFCAGFDPALRTWDVLCKVITAGRQECRRVSLRFIYVVWCTQRVGGVGERGERVGAAARNKKCVMEREQGRGSGGASSGGNEREGTQGGETEQDRRERRAARPASSQLA